MTDKTTQYTSTGRRIFLWGGWIGWAITVTTLLVHWIIK